MTSSAANLPAASAASTKSAKSGRVWAWLGLASFIAGVFVTWSVQFVLSSDDFNAGGQRLFDQLNTSGNETLYRISSGIGYLVVAGLITFAVGFRRFLTDRSNEATNLPDVIFGSILVTAAALGLAMSLRAQVFGAINSYDDTTASHITINRLQQDGVLAAWATMLAATVATSIGGLRYSMVPKGIAWFSVVMSVLITGACLTGVPFPANIPALLWLGVISIWALRAAGRA